MADIEKVINGLSTCTNETPGCEPCPYRKLPEEQDCATALMKEALELLKEQEALAVCEDKVNKCVCGNEINRYWHPEYCGFCGKKLVWY